jgi:hypothetical protein
MSGIFQSMAQMFRPTQQVTEKLAQTNPGAAEPPPPAGTSLPNTDIKPAPNPLDEFASIWQTDPKSTPPVDPLSTPIFNSDPAKIAAAASKINFIDQIPPELVAKASSGNDPQAFMQVMNAVAQRALATATQLNAATIEQATTRNNARIEAALPDRVKRINLDTMVPENPVLQHAASQPLLKIVRAQIQMNNPNMSAAEINARTEQYLTGFAQQLTQPVQEAAAATKPQGTDWDTWINTSI